MAFVAEQVAPHKKRLVETVDEMPNPPSGKILGRLLRGRSNVGLTGAALAPGSWLYDMSGAQGPPRLQISFPVEGACWLLDMSEVGP